MEPSDPTLKEVYRLTRENNEMLHKMRRSAFMWGFLKFAVYAALLAAPIWFYMTYLNGAVQSMLDTVNKIEGTNAQAQNQIKVFQDAWEQFQQRFKDSSTTQQ